MSLVSNDGLSLTDAARRVGVTPATLRRWLRDGLIPQHDGNGWTTAALGQARVVARMRERGHSLQSIRKASEQGRLAYAYADELFPETDHQYTLGEAARESGELPTLLATCEADVVHEWGLRRATWLVPR